MSFASKKYVHSISPDPAKREATDFYRTPEWVTAAIMVREEMPGPILEPACGDGAISEMLKKRGHTVISSDLYDHGYGDIGRDFLNSLYKIEIGTIITNPPYAQIEPFIHHSLQIATHKVIILGRLLFLEGKNRRDRMFDGHTPLSRIYVLSERANVARQDDQHRGDKHTGGMVCFCWFVWDKVNYNGNTTVHWI
jgi:hypothetical protein